MRNLTVLITEISIGILWPRLLTRQF